MFNIGFQFFKNTNFNKKSHTKTISYVKYKSSQIFCFKNKLQIMHWDANKIFKILPFCNTYIEKPKVKKLNNVQLLKELPFYDEWSIVENKTAFTGYARSYKLKLLIKEM